MTLTGLENEIGKWIITAMTLLAVTFLNYTVLNAIDMLADKNIIPKHRYAMAFYQTMFYAAIVALMS